MVHSVPEIPGRQEQNTDIVAYLKEHLARLCGDGNPRPRFPGSQPISFTSEHLELLEQRDFWVCEKSDGLRVLLFTVMNQGNGNQEAWLVSHAEHCLRWTTTYFIQVDRKHQFYNITSLPYMGDKSPDTVIDGELIIDTDPDTKQVSLPDYHVPGSGKLMK